MKWVRTNVLLTVIIVGCLAAMGNDAGQGSASYELTKSVMSGGGTTSMSVRYSLTGTFGQPSLVAVSDSESFGLGSGFWGATVKLFTVAIESVSYSIAEGARITWHSIADASYTIQFTDSASPPGPNSRR